MNLLKCFYTEAIRILQVSFGDMIACDNENVKNAFPSFCDLVVLIDVLTVHCLSLVLLFDSAKEANGSIMLVLASLQRRDLKPSGIVQPAGNCHTDDASIYE